MAPEGCTWGLAPAQEDREVLLHYAERFREEERPVIVGEDIESFRIPEENAGLQFDVIVGRNLFTRRPDKGHICGRLFELLSGEWRLSLVEVVPSKAQRLSAFIPDGSLSEEELAAWKKAEESVYSDPANPLVNWNEETLKTLLSAAGFSGVSFLSVSYREVRVPGERECSSWFDVKREGYGSVILRELGSELFEKGKKILTSRLSGAEVDWLSTVCYLSGSRGAF
jgi:putative ATPase